MHTQRVGRRVDEEQQEVLVPDGLLLVVQSARAALVEALRAERQRHVRVRRVHCIRENYGCG